MRQRTYTTSAIRRQRRLSRTTPIATAVLLCLVMMLNPLHAQIFDPYQVKAVFLYNLTNFIKWPASGSQGHGRPFRIAVLGRDPFGPALAKAVDREAIQGRKVVLIHYRGLEALRRQPCDLLFVSEDQFPIWPQIRSIARQHAILTVSEVEGFAHRGGMVNLLTSGRRIRIEINIEEARRNGFDISAKLLKLARIVNGGKDK